MPGGDGTGPMGMGTMTGRATGFCAGYGVPGYMNPGPAKGFRGGCGRGIGRRSPMGLRTGGHGWRNMFCATGLPGWVRTGMAYAQNAATPKQELELLKQEEQNLGVMLEDIRKQIKEVESSSKDN